jgi:hypothetical protein
MTRQVYKQPGHPVIKLIPEEVLAAVPMEQAVAMLKERERLIMLMENDPLHHGYEPPRWREIYLQAARKRLEFPGVPLEGLVSGAIRAGKTTLGGRIANAHFFHTPKAWVWCFHSTEDSSDTIQQPVIYHYLPPEFKTGGVSMKKSKTQKMGYVEGHGFIGAKFTLMSRTMQFLTYKMKIGDLQGSALTFVWGDELIPKAFTETIRERLLTAAKDTWEMVDTVEEAVKRLEAGKPVTNAMLAAIFHATALYSFTPKDGWTDTVQEFHEDAVTLTEEPAELLEKVVNGRRRPVMVPLSKQPRKPTRWIAYLHTKHNDVRGNWEGMKQELVGASEERIRCVAYGDVVRNTAGAFPKFGRHVHGVPLSAAPKEGTVYFYVDPAGRKNWFAAWILVDPTGDSYVLEEWPRQGDDLPNIGDPGPWAVNSKNNKHDGDAGEAQRGFGFSLQRYKDEFARIEKRLGRWKAGAELRTWKDPDTGLALVEFIGKEDAPAWEPEERHIDSRYANAKRDRADEDDCTTLLEQLGELGMDFYPAPGEHLDEGVSLINDALDYDQARPRDVTNKPRLFVAAHCHAFLWALDNWTGIDGQKGACKEPIDILRWHFTGDPEHVTPEARGIRPHSRFAGRKPEMAT